MIPNITFVPERRWPYKSKVKFNGKGNEGS